MYKLEIKYKNQTMSREYKEDRHGIVSMHSDIISLLNKKLITMSDSDMLLDKTDNIKANDSISYKFNDLQITIARTADTKSKNIIMTQNEIIDLIKMSKESSKELHITIYNDGVWKIDLERHPYGLVRFWVSREDKQGNYNCSLFAPYEILPDGSIRYGADFKIKKAVVDKIASTYKALIKSKLLE